MAPIDDAIAELKSHEAGERPSYKDCAAKFGVDRNTLSRRFRGVEGSVHAQTINKQKLNPQQELELIAYMKDLTGKGIPPMREMTRIFAEQVAKDHVGIGWVRRFLDRNKEALTSKVTSHIDAVRFRADSEAKYDLYFDLLHAKIKEYNVLPENTYNMDEKGFAIGVIGKSKRIFGKASWLEKEQREAIQDGSREWITLLAGVCADGSCLPPGLIFQSKNKAIRSQKAQKITASLHHLQVQNELLLHEDEGLKHALTTKKKHKKKSKVLDLQQREEYHGGAVFWSPSKIREARYRERVRACEEEQEKLRKSNEKDLKAAAALYKKQQLKKKRVEREALQKERAKEKEREAAERAELQRKKQQEKEAATAQKALQLSQKGKRAASPSIGPKPKRRRVAQPAKGGAGGGDPAPSPPPKINPRGRKPKKFK